MYGNCEQTVLQSCPARHDPELGPASSNFTCSQPGQSRQAFPEEICRKGTAGAKTFK